MVQEALTNVVKHAGATCADIRLEFQEEVVSVQVEDDGVGFNVNLIAMDNRKAWGLLGMRERASLVGGALTVNSSPGEGTRVALQVQLSPGTPLE